MAGVVCDLGVAARAIHNGKILLVKEARGNYQNLWGLPKGSVDEGESPESAVLARTRRRNRRQWDDCRAISGQVNPVQGKASSVPLLRCKYRFRTDKFVYR